MTKPVELAFCQSLVVLIQLNKIYAQALVQMKIDVAALHETVKGLDPTFEATYADRKKLEKKKQAQATLKVVELSQTLDVLLKLLQDMQTQLLL